MKYKELHRILKKGGCIQLPKQTAGHPTRTVLQPEWSSPHQTMEQKKWHAERSTAYERCPDSIFNHSLKATHKTNTQMKKVKVYIERSEDGCFYAYAANPMILPYGLTGEGDSVEQAKQTG